MSHHPHGVKQLWNEIKVEVRKKLSHATASFYPEARGETLADPLAKASRIPLETDEMGHALVDQFRKF